MNATARKKKTLVLTPDPEKARQSNHMKDLMKLREQFKQTGELPAAFDTPTARRLIGVPARERTARNGTRRHVTEGRPMPEIVS